MIGTALKCWKVPKYGEASVHPNTLELGAGVNLISITQWAGLNFP